MVQILVARIIIIVIIIIMITIIIIQHLYSTVNSEDT